MFLIACKDSNSDGDSLIRANSIKEIILFEGNTPHNGDFNGRSGIESLCQSSPNKPNRKLKAHGFISIDNFDTIRNMPFNYYFPADVPIKAVNGNIVADNWNDLTDGMINDSLFNLGVSAVNNVYWWSGVDITAYGNLQPSQNCNNFTGGGNGQRGNTGAISSPLWMSGSAAVCGGNSGYLCIAF